MKVNFYWSGQNWRLFNRITIASHVKVGHEVVMWVGEKPGNEYWIDDLDVKFVPADKYGSDWRPESFSDYFMFLQMEKSGECWADCDAVALREWPDQEWLIIPAHPRRYASLGIVRIPAGHPVFDCVIPNIRKKRPNTKAFEACLQKYGIQQTHEREQFYPVDCVTSLKMRGSAYHKLDVPDDTYSYHFYHKTRQRNSIPEQSYLKELCERFL